MAEKDNKPRSRWQEAFQNFRAWNDEVMASPIANFIGPAGGLQGVVKWLNSPSAEEAARAAKPAKAAAAAPKPEELAFGLPTTPGFQNYAGATVQQESGGRYGVVNPESGAAGIGQVMPATGKVLAERAGLKWQPELMTGTTPVAQDYQRQITQLALEDAWKNGGGDPAKAARYYFAGPNPALHGPKTDQYVSDIMERMGLSMATAEPGNPFQARGVPFVDPQTAMGMIPNPTPVRKMDLPDAPVLQADPERPQYMTADVPALLEELKLALTPVTPDQEARKKDLLFGDIQGAIQGSLIGLAGGPLGVLLGAAMGGLNAHAGNRRGQLGEDKLKSEQARLAAIELATKGLGLNLDNLTVGNKNLDQNFLTKKNQVDTENTNALNANQRLVEELLQNSGIDKFNVAALNDTNRTRASVGISALEGAANAQGRVNQMQQNLDAASLSYGGGDGALKTRANQILAGVGIPAERLDGAKADASLDNVRNTAYAVAAGNVEGALGGMAQEIVSAGLAGSILSEGDAKAVEKAIREKNLAQATQLVANALTANKQLAAQLSDELAARGLMTAKIISGNRKRANPPAGQQQPDQAARN